MLRCYGIHINTFEHRAKDKRKRRRNKDFYEKVHNQSIKYERQKENWLEK